MIAQIKSIIDEYMLSEITRHTSNAVIITGLDGKIQYVNEGFTKITEYTREEVIGLKPGKLLQGEGTDPETIKRIRKKIRNYERVKETIINYSKSGRKYWLQLDIYPYFDEHGIPSHFMAIESDVTELKENERIAREQNLRIQENISYAEKLQNALFRKGDQVSELFDDGFILDLPKDTVGGDFYLVEKIQNKRVVLLGDCTGHGASGAMMTAVCISVVRELLETYKTLSPAMIIKKAQEKVRAMINDEKTGINDGFEATLIFIDDSKKEIRYASTNQELYFLSNAQQKVFKGLRGHSMRTSTELSDKSIKYDSGSMIYLSSDGLKDQFGGPKDKKYTSKQLFELLTDLYEVDCKKQADMIHGNLELWKASNGVQTDDIMLIGLRL